MAIKNPLTGQPIIEAGGLKIDRGTTQEELAKQNPNFQGDTAYFNVGGVKTALPVFGSRKQQPQQTQQTNQQPAQEAPMQERPVYNRPASALDQANQRFQDTLSGQAQMPTQEEIRQQELARAQALIDATRGVYEEEVGRIKQQGAERLKETKSIAVGAGLAGSPFRTTPEARTQEATNDQLRFAQKERQAEIAQIMSAAEGRATSRFDKERELARQGRLDSLTEQQLQIDLLKQQQQGARDKIKTLSQGGYSLDELSEQEYQALLEDSGLSDFEARALQNINNPAAQADYSVQNGQLIGYFIDPVTGKPNISTTAIPGLEGVEKPNIQEFDGVPYVIGVDAEGEFKGEVLNGWKPKEEGAELLSVNEAEKLGVPYGTTQEQAFGIEMVENEVGGLTDSQRKTLIGLRGEANKDPDIKGFIDIRDAYDRVQASAKDPSAAGDLALIFNYMKVLDPSSVVRESEFATAENAGSIPERIRAQFNKVQSGERLSEEQRKDFVDRAERLFEPKKSNYEQAVDFYEEQARIDGIPVERVVRDYLTPDSDNNNQQEQENGNAYDFMWGDETSFNQVGGDTNQAATDVSNIRDESRVSTVVGNGKATGIQKGSSVNAYGLDLVLEGGRGAATKSPIDGKVVSVRQPSQTGGFGKQVKIQGNDGRIWTVNHLDGFNVKAGDTVRRGQTVIGRQGNTGTILTKDKRTGKYRTPTAAERAAGKGTHLDITVYDERGNKLSSQDVASLLETKQIG